MVGRARFGTSSCFGRAAIRVPTFYPAGSVSLRDPYPGSHLLRANVPRVGPICMAASFSPSRGRLLTTQLKPGRVRPDWRSEVLCSGEPGAWPTSPVPTCSTGSFPFPRLAPGEWPGLRRPAGLGSLSRPHDGAVCPSCAGFGRGFSGPDRRHHQRGHSEEPPKSRDPWIGQIGKIIRDYQLGIRRGAPHILEIGVRHDHVLPIPEAVPR